MCRLKSIANNTNKNRELSVNQTDNCYWDYLSIKLCPKLHNFGQPSKIPGL